MHYPSQKSAKSSAITNRKTIAEPDPIEVSEIIVQPLKSIISSSTTRQNPEMASPIRLKIIFFNHYQ